MARYTLVFASDERNRGGGRGNNVFVYADTDAEAEAMGTALAAVINGKLVSINKQIVSNGYDALPEGLPGNLVKVTMKNAQGVLETISWVFGAPGTDEAAIKAIFNTGAGATLKNRYGGDLGTVLRVVITPLSEE